MNILGLSAFYHDSAACLVQDGRVRAAAQEERFTRRKHDDAFPRRAVDYCLAEAGLTIAEINLVVFYEKPFLKFDRLLHTYLACAPSGLGTFLRAMPIWLKDKFWMKLGLQRELNFPGKILFCDHHESHAASAFFPSPFDEAAYLTVDGVGEWTTTSYGRGRGHELEMLGELKFPHSLGLLYSAFTYYAGFRVNSGEYKLMGLAPYGQPVYQDLILRELIDLKSDGSFRLDLNYFDFAVGRTMINRRFERLFGGPPRAPEAPLTRRDMDIARSIQEVTEEILCRLARHVVKETGLRSLCLAGGVALNCVANGRLLREGIVDRLWIQPAAGDAGGALGAALCAWHGYLGRERRADGSSDSQQGSLLGPAFEDAALKAFLDEQRVPYTELDESALADRVAQLIADGHVVGWFEGRMEFGPRALGSRSILGDARSASMQELMNLKIKFRESFRPFAPAVLRERASEYFDLPPGQDSPYMLLVAQVADSQRRALSGLDQARQGLDRRHAARSAIPAVTHVDGSARVQTVEERTHPRFHALLKAFEKRTGCPVLINTSFNVRGEPIVAAPADAYRCFCRTNMDYLVLGRCLVRKSEELPLDKDREWLKEFDLD